MKKSVLVLGMLCMNGMGIANASESTNLTLKVPPQAILEAAQKLESQRGPFYSVEGTIHCRSYKLCGMIQRICTLSLDGILGQHVQIPIGGTDELLSALSVGKFGKTFILDAGFKAQSLSREFPPYTTTSSAEIYDLVVKEY